MLKKGQPVKLRNPSGTMSRVYESITKGHHYQEHIRRDTGLLIGQVRSAIYSLSYVGMIYPGGVNKRRGWYLHPPESKASSIFSGATSIFSVNSDV